MESNGTDTALVPLEPQGGMIAPVADMEHIVEAWNAFVRVKDTLIKSDPDAWCKIEGKPRIRKAGWRKIAAAFGISTEITYAERRELDNGLHVWEFRVRATAPNGRYAEAAGACASDERRFAHKLADPYAQAETRATTRAISNLVGGGELSAEEVEWSETAAVEDLAQEAGFVEARASIVHRCDGCYADIRPIDVQGRRLSVEEVVAGSKARFGKAYCAACLREVAKIAQAVDAEPASEEE